MARRRADETRRHTCEKIEKLAVCIVSSVLLACRQLRRRGLLLEAVVAHKFAVSLTRAALLLSLLLALALLLLVALVIGVGSLALVHCAHTAATIGSAVQVQSEPNAHRSYGCTLSVYLTPYLLAASGSFSPLALDTFNVYCR